MKRPQCPWRNQELDTVLSDSKSWMMLNFWSEAGSFIQLSSTVPEIEMNFDYVLRRKCMQNLQEAAGAALTLASAPAIMIAERNERVKNVRNAY